MRSIVYHQCEALHIIKPKVEYTLSRDEIQGRRADLDDIHDCVVMIYQSFGLDKKIRILTNADFLAGALGVEPSSGVLETLILPMNYAPLFDCTIIAQSSLVLFN